MFLCYHQKPNAMQGPALAVGRHWCAPAQHALVQHALPSRPGSGAVSLAASLQQAALAFLLDHQVRAAQAASTAPGYCHERMWLLMVLVRLCATYRCAGCMAQCLAEPWCVCMVRGRKSEHVG